MPVFSVILPAAGLSARFGEVGNKLLQPIAGIPVLRRSVNAFLCRTDVARIVIPTRDEQLVRSLLPADPRIEICPGGNCRAQSVKEGLKRIGRSDEWVAIHDAARPLVSQALIDACFEKVLQHGAVVPCLPVALTIKQAAGALPAKVLRTVPRHDLYAMQTPQVMAASRIEEAFARTPFNLEEVTDDVQLLESIGVAVYLIPGEQRNIKITSPIDLIVAEALLRT